VNPVAVVRFVGFAVAAHVDGDDTVFVAQPFNLVFELRGRLRPTGNQHQRFA
jgi:hypothetical protein